ncbi:MAG: hypothetical protein RLN76_11240 [Phycisphaeraceae bacterium]
MAGSPSTSSDWAERELKRLAQQAVTGDRYGAMLGLSDWLIRGGAPEEAGVLRAALDGRPAVEAQVIDEPGRVSNADVDAVAGALGQRMDLLPTMVRALELRADEGLVALMLAVGRRLWGSVVVSEDRLVVCEAMARLSMLAQDEKEATRWAHEGLRIDPASARLALIVGRCADDQRHGPPARVVLTRAARAWPAYRDVRAALIRRRADDGKQASARRMLGRWLEREPRSPLARRLAEELAA